MLGEEEDCEAEEDDVGQLQSEQDALEVDELRGGEVGAPSVAEAGDWGLCQVHRGLRQNTHVSITEDNN